MLASMIFRKEPFFHGHDNYDQVDIVLFQRLILINLVGQNCKSIGYGRIVHVH